MTACRDIIPAPEPIRTAVYGPYADLTLEPPTARDRSKQDGRPLGDWPERRSRKRHGGCPPIRLRGVADDLGD